MYPVTPTLSVEGLQVRSISEEVEVALADGSTATAAACHVAAVLSVNVDWYEDGGAPSPLSESRKLEEAVGCGVKPFPEVKVSPTELFAQPSKRSLAFTVVTAGLVTLSVCVPASSPIVEMASIGAGIFEPFTTNTEITRDSAAERVRVKVWPGPTVGFLAYQICERRSKPVLVFVGPAAEIQVLLKLSDGVIVTPAWEEPYTTIKSPPVLSKGVVV
jgi:hypothetical protein